jgi:hypothetical protein
LAQQLSWPVREPEKPEPLLTALPMELQQGILPLIECSLSLTQIAQRGNYERGFGNWALALFPLELFTPQLLLNWNTFGHS